MSHGLAALVSGGPHSALIVTGGFLKMLLMVRMTQTCVVTRMVVPRMDLGVILLTLKFDGNTATYLDVHQEVNGIKHIQGIPLLLNLLQQPSSCAKG